MLRAGRPGATRRPGDVRCSTGPGRPRGGVSAAGGGDGPVPVDVVDMQDKVVARAELFSAVKEVVRAGLAREGLDPSSVEVSIALVDDTRIRELNNRYRGVDAATDVLSFGLGDGDMPGEPAVLGDVVISLETAARADPDEEGLVSRVRLLAVHGLLHLLGYDHGTDEEAREMETREAEILADVASRHAGGGGA